MKKSLARSGIILIISTAFIWQCIGAWQDSQTTDEAVHLSAGRAYWQTAAWYLNPEHPALFKLWAAVPLLLAPHTGLDTNTQPWLTRNQWTIGASYLYLDSAQWRYGAQLLMFMGRLPMILIWLGLVVTLSAYSWRRWGAWPALAVTATIAYDPNFLGHGHLVTNDVAAAFAYLGTFLMLHRFIRGPSWSRLAWFALVFGLAQLTKYSMLILWMVIPFLLLVARMYRLADLSWSWIRRALLTLLLVTGFLTWAVYGFSLPKISNDSRIAELWIERQKIVAQQPPPSLPRFTELFVTLANPEAPTGKFLEVFQHSYLPGYWYWRGLFSAASHNTWGHGAYLIGQVSILGWWYYFPVALAVKTPILMLGAVASVILLWLNQLRKVLRHRLPFKQFVPFDAWILGFPPLIYLLWSMTSHINLGVRHAFPTYVFFPLAVGSLIALVNAKSQRLAALMAGWLAIVTITIAVVAWPNTIGYYNGLIGGTQQGHRYVLDSNLDWNQDIWRLRKYLNEQSFPEVHLALFGSIPSDRIFPELLSILQDDQINAGIKPSGIVVISAGQLYNVDGPFSWLRTYQPSWRIGSSILVYDFR